MIQYETYIDIHNDFAPHVRAKLQQSSIWPNVVRIDEERDDVTRIHFQAHYGSEKEWDNFCDRIDRTIITAISPAGLMRFTLNAAVMKVGMKVRDAESDGPIMEVASFSIRNSGTSSSVEQVDLTWIDDDGESQSKTCDGRGLVYYWPDYGNPSKTLRRFDPAIR